ncbi:hypothetical protein Amet_1807 [Alkaliphilus metalliredigens QYMF]|uniref:Uncharacterized protein n=1 Tax=Alkaliphilus metalliredigens (strain QYMF) TaxID=293826 RepID=A6TP59_ALKMQ|nr:hypothetical protein [Alkaliphilus metalliredigens]ABR47977.1 hypothetical protein Amet_1807 [Alkaliphilus metalliredigens QYMF]
MFKKYFIKSGLIWSILNVVYLVLSVVLLQYIRLLVGRIYDPRPMYLAATVIPFLFGTLLRLPALIERWESNKKFNWIKFLNQGLIALILTFLTSPAFYAFNYRIPTMLSLAEAHEIVLYLTAVWLGMSITDCIKGIEKVDSINEHN